MRPFVELEVPFRRTYRRIPQPLASAIESFRVRSAHLPIKATNFSSQASRPSLRLLKAMACWKKEQSANQSPAPDIELDPRLPEGLAPVRPDRRLDNCGRRPPEGDGLRYHRWAPSAGRTLYSLGTDGDLCRI